MTADQVVSVTEGEPDGEQPFRSMMEFLSAAEAAGVGDGIRSSAVVRHEGEAEAFVRLSVFPAALQLMSRLLTAHAAALPKQQTDELLRALVGEAPA